MSGDTIQVDRKALERCAAALPGCALGDSIRALLSPPPRDGDAWDEAAQDYIDGCNGIVQVSTLATHFRAVYGNLQREDATRRAERLSPFLDIDAPPSSPAPDSAGH